MTSEDLTKLSEEPVEFSYPEGFQKAAHMLDMFSDDQTREAMLLAFIKMIMMQ